MRDLASQSYSRGTRGLPKSVKILLILALVLSASIFLKDRFFSSSSLSSSSIVLRDAPKGLTPVSVAETSLVDDNGGVSLISENTTFTNVSGINGKATANRKFGDGTYVLSVNATLPTLTGDKYQVWIVADTIKLAGTMQGIGGNFSLVFRDSDKYSKYDEIWITREITGNDEKPEKHILEGSF